MTTNKKMYLGDSVYATFDGYGIELTTENGEGAPSNIIYLEPDVVATLLSMCNNKELRLFEWIT